MRKILVGLAVGALTVGCGIGTDSGTSLDSNGTAFNSVSKALGSLSGLVSRTQRAGVASTYCSATGGPLDGSGGAVADTSNNYPGAVGFCQASHNAQSPDTVAGAMYLAGGMACEAAKAELFTGLTDGQTKTVQTNVVISTTCWGTQAQVDAFVADIGTSIIPNVNLTVEDLSTGAYDYKVTFTGVGREDVSAYIKNSDGVIAGLFPGSDPWAFTFTTATGTLLFEGIDNTNTRRTRLKVVGTLNSTNDEFTAVTSIQGFWYQGNGSGFGTAVNFNGNLTVGMVGDVIKNGSSVTVDDQCYLPGGTGTCNGLTALNTPEADMDNLYSNRTTAATNLAAELGAVISFTNIDSSDFDITD